MIFWVDRPVAQWLHIGRDPHHRHPWYVQVGSSIRARCTTEKEAQAIVDNVRAIFDALQVPA